MDARFYRYYAGIFERTGRWPGLLPRFGRPAYFGEANEVREIIVRTDEALRMEHGTRLRPDAKFLLYLNGWQMVLRPLVAARAVDPTEALFDLEADIRMIALQSASSDDVKEISAHRVTDSVSRLWGELRVSRWDLWE